MLTAEVIGGAFNRSRQRAASSRETSAQGSFGFTDNQKRRLATPKLLFHKHIDSLPSLLWYYRSWSSASSMFNMVRGSSIFFLLGATAAAQLDITSLLDNLGPAPASDPRFTNWIAPGPNDLRSPCPGLNALANHGFIHHDGRNMTLPHLITGLAEGMSMGVDFTVLIGAAGLLSSPNPLGGSFTLSDIDQHNFFIEHDASLSRQDAYFGNDYSFYNPYWQNVLSFFDGYDGKTALLPAAESIANRTQDSLAKNPTFTYGFREFLFRYGETAIYLQAMGGDDATGVTRLDWVRMLFEQEKLPVELGWRPRKEPITIPSLGEMVFNLFSVSPEKVPEGQRITKDSYKDAFELLIGGSEILNNLTSGLSSALNL
nr:putative sterigmatocystin biosynthesis peroxidase stcc [Quercus suber]